VQRLEQAAAERQPVLVQVREPEVWSRVEEPESTHAHTHTLSLSPSLSLTHTRGVLLCFIKPILGNRYVRSRGFIVSEPRETHPRSEIADVPTLPCPPLDNLGCPDRHPPT